MARARWRPQTVAQAAAALLLFFIPAVAVIVFGFVVRDFVPSSKLQNAAAAIALAASLWFTWEIARVTVPQLRQALWARRIRAVMGYCALIAFAPILGFSLLYVFFAGPVSYALHRATEIEVVETTHDVLYADRLGHARCRNRVILRGHGMLWNRQLCSVSEETVERLSRGGAVVTRGAVSAFGETVRSFRVVALPANRPFDTDAGGGPSVRSGPFRRSPVNSDVQPQVQPAAALD